MPAREPDRKGPEDNPIVRSAMDLPANEAREGVPAARMTRMRFAGGIALFALAYYAAYRFGMAPPQDVASPFWFPDSVLLAALLLSSPRHWWIYLLIPLPIRLIAEAPADLPFGFLLATYAIDVAQALGAALLLRRWLRDPARFGTVRDLAIFVFVAVLLVPASSAFLGGAARQAVFEVGYWPAWEQWFLGDALAQLMVTPAILYWVLPRPGEWQLLSRRSVEAATLGAGMLLTSWFAFDGGLGEAGVAAPRVFLPVPFMLWGAVRFRMTGATAGVAVMSFFSVRASLLGALAGGAAAGTAGIFLQLIALRAPLLYFLAIFVQQVDRAESRLRESEFKFRTMADFAPVMIWVCGANGQCEWLSRRWLEFVGHTLEEEIGEGWSRNIHRDDFARTLRTYQKASDARLVFTMEYRARRHDGEYRWLLSTGVPRFSSDGEFIGYIGSCVDIADRKTAELAAQQDRSELARMTRLSTMGQLLASLAHELNQPLTAIRSNAEAGRRMVATNRLEVAELRSCFEDIVRDDRRASEIIVNLRAMARKEPTERVPLDVSGVVHDVVSLLHSDAVMHQVSLAIDLSQNLPRVHGDRVELQQVLLNLLMNAFSSMTETPLGQRVIDIVIRPAGGMVRVEVRDRGIGLPEEDTEEVFEPFFTTREEGLGMGLAISRTIVEGHGGRLWAENNLYGGATFTFEIPAIGHRAAEAAGH